MKDIRIHQLYYTSCQQGLSGYAGFQVCTESEGFPPEDRMEVQQKGSYTPPRDLPREPDADTISAQFPTAFRMTRLASGRMVLLRSVYVGQDYSERWGNYFFHALLLDEMPKGHWPIDLYTWPGWVERLQKDDDKTKPEPLPTIQVEDILSNISETEFSFSKLKDFLREKDGRIDALSKMLMAVFQRASTSRSIVIRESDAKNSLYWIACIQKAFPNSLQEELTFSTFQFSPRGCQAINATMGETDFLFNEIEQHQFYEFDTLTGKYSDLPMENAEYAKVISTWMASDPDKIEGFHEFAKGFACDKIGPDLLHLIQLYQLDIGEPVELGQSGITSILEFVKNRAKPDGFARSLNILGSSIRNLDVASSFDDWSLVIRFLAKGAQSTGNADYFQYACQAWVEAFDHFVISQQAYEANVMELKIDLEQMANSNSRYLAQIFLSDTHLDWMLAHTSSLSGKNLGIVMTEIESSCRILGDKPTYKAQAVRSLIEAVLSNNPGHIQDFQWALKPYKGQLEGLVSIIEHIVAVQEELDRGNSISTETLQKSNNALGQALFSMFNSANEEARFKVLNRLKKDERFLDVLVGEWQASIEFYSDKTGAYKTYERKILSDGSDFAIKMGERFANMLLDYLPLDRQRQQAGEWVKSRRCHEFSDPTAKRVLLLAVHQVSLSPNDRASKQLAALITQELAERYMDIRMERLVLRSAADRIITNPGELEGLHDVLGDIIEPDLYREFVKLVLSQLLVGNNTPKAHIKILKTLAVENHKETFKEVYVNFLAQRSHVSQVNEFDRIATTALISWLRFTQSAPAWLNGIKEAAIKTLAEQMALLNKKDLANAKAGLERQPAFRDKQGAQALNDFLEQVEKNRPSWFVRLFGKKKK